MMVSDVTAEYRTITISLSPALQARVNSRTTVRGVSRSEFVRGLIERELDGEIAGGAVESRLGFIELAIDALLKHHPNSELREVVHNTHRERLQRRQLMEVES